MRRNVLVVFGLVLAIAILPPAVIYPGGPRTGRPLPPSPGVVVPVEWCHEADRAAGDQAILPAATGTVRYLPEMGIKERAPVGDMVQSDYFRTTEQNREFRRGFAEFAIPDFGGRLQSATLVLTETRGWTSYPLPPDTHDVSFYWADLAVTTADYDRETTYCASFQTDANEPTSVFRIDVTNVVARFQGQDLGFRAKLAADPEITFMGFAGSQFGELYNLPPTIEVRLA